ncbi:retrovirus-related Pol polyprotein from transposon 412 [Trichonephila clavipes]|nr:retrovirus-related Pol polyprotein from transposon 412 [Trichonephila clavipes]
MKGIYVLFPTHPGCLDDQQETSESQMNCSLMMSFELSDEQRNKLSELLRKFSGLFTKTDKSTAAKTNVKHRIFTGDHAPINQRAYRVSPTERRIIHEEVQKMLDEGIVQPSESPWSSPIVLSLLKSGVEFHWGPKEVEAFNSLKESTYFGSVLGMYDERASTEIHTDASGILQEGLPDGPSDFKEHDFDVKYKTGKKHSDADALSRNPVEEEAETSDKFLAVTTSMNLAMEQKKDQDLAKLKLLSNSSKNEEFRFIDGILCRKNFDPDGKLWLPVIPKHLRADILRHFHDAPPPQDTLVSRKLMTGYARDFTGRECTEMSFAEVDEIAKFLLEEIVLRHGAPRVIITDRGAVFRSRLVSSLVDLCNIDHRFTTAYHPQTNGLTERFNKTLSDMLSMYVDVEQKNWDEILPFVTFAYNTAKQETTGFTPFYLLHGREAETTLDTMLPFCPNDFDDNNITKIAARAEESRQLARVHTLRAQDKDRRRYDSKHQMVSYAPGDLVWVYTPVRKVGLSEKLLRRYFGPYQVLRRLSAVTYEVQDFDPASRKRKLREVVHVLRMKPYHDPAEQIETEDIPPKESYKGPITRSRIKTLEQNDSGALSSFSRGAMPHA